MLAVSPLPVEGNRVFEERPRSALVAKGQGEGFPVRPPSASCFAPSAPSSWASCSSPTSYFVAFVSSSWPSCPSFTRQLYPTIK